MTCRCNFHSPFLFAQHPRDSIFMRDPHFYRGASTGMTQGQQSTAAVIRFENRTGRSNGTVHGMSDAADLQAATRPYHRVRSRAPSHNRSKA